MSKLVRFGISLERDLSEKFDRLVREKKYHCRSDAFRDLIRRELVEKEWLSGSEVAGTITLIFDHHKRETVDKITDIQHDFQKIIISTQHVHLDHNHCLEAIVVKGMPGDVHGLADALRAVKGIKHAALGMSTTGKSIS